VRTAAAVAGAVAVAGCGIALRRDLSAVPPQSVVYDDMCQVQPYHDALVAGKSQGPKLLHSTETEKADGTRPIGGMATFSFEDNVALEELRRQLSENWDRVPPGLLAAPRLELAVQWAEKAGVRRVVTTRDAQISDGKATYYLPYHVCLSEFLYGAPLYKTRREMLGLAGTPMMEDAAAPPVALPGLDAGAAAAMPDAGPVPASPAAPALPASPPGAPSLPGPPPPL
jgi:hypothetical protein